MLCVMLLCAKQPIYSPYCCGIDYQENVQLHELEADCKECVCSTLVEQPFLAFHEMLVVARENPNEPSIQPVDHVLVLQS